MAAVHTFVLVTLGAIAILLFFTTTVPFAAAFISTQSLASALWFSVLTGSFASGTVPLSLASLAFFTVALFNSRKFFFPRALAVLAIQPETLVYTFAIVVHALLFLMTLMVIRSAALLTLEAPDPPDLLIQFVLPLVFVLITGAASMLNYMAYRWYASRLVKLHERGQKLGGFGKKPPLAAKNRQAFGTLQWNGRTVGNIDCSEPMATSTTAGSPSIYDLNLSVGICPFILQQLAPNAGDNACMLSDTIVTQNWDLFHAPGFDRPFYVNHLSSAQMNQLSELEDAIVHLDDVIANDTSYHITAPAGYGLTVAARTIVLRASIVARDRVALLVSARELSKALFAAENESTAARLAQAVCATAEAAGFSGFNPSAVESVIASRQVLLVIDRIDLVPQIESIERSLANLANDSAIWKMIVTGATRDRSLVPPACNMTTLALSYFTHYITEWKKRVDLPWIPDSGSSDLPGLSPFWALGALVPADPELDAVMGSDPHPRPSAMCGSPHSALTDMGMFRLIADSAVHHLKSTGRVDTDFLPTVLNNISTLAAVAFTVQTVDGATQWAALKAALTRVACRSEWSFGQNGGDDSSYDSEDDAMVVTTPQEIRKWKKADLQKIVQGLVDMFPIIGINTSSYGIGTVFGHDGCQKFLANYHIAQIYFDMWKNDCDSTQVNEESFGSLSERHHRVCAALNDADIQTPADFMSNVIQSLPTVDSDQPIGGDMLIYAYHVIRPHLEALAVGDNPSENVELALESLDLCCDVSIVADQISPYLTSRNDDDSGQHVWSISRTKALAALRELCRNPHFRLLLYPSSPDRSHAGVCQSPLDSVTTDNDTAFTDDLSPVWMPGVSAVGPPTPVQPTLPPMGMMGMMPMPAAPSGPRPPQGSYRRVSVAM